MAQSVLEELAADTWSRIPLVRSLRLAFGEETFTDLLLLDLMLRAGRRARIVPTTKPDEAKQGTDWEWWIGSNSTGWIHYVIQAKRIAGSGNRYKSLTHKVGGVPQIDLLEGYAQSQGAFPLYCFYNSVERPDFSSFWHCGLKLDAPQLGCTVVPSPVVRKAIQTHGGKNFDFIHQDDRALPWRCLTSCPWIAATYLAKAGEELPARPNLGLFSRDIRPQPHLPALIESALESGEEIDWGSPEGELPDRLFPRRVVVFEAENDIRTAWTQTRRGYPRSRA